MKKPGVIFLQMALIILVFAFTAGLNVRVIRENQVLLAWDPVQNPENFPEGFELGYCIYICESTLSKDDAELVEKTVNNKVFKAEAPITDTRCTIDFQDTGTFFIGVQSVVYEKGKTEVCNKEIKDEYRSEIAWSDNDIYTNYDPFVVKFGQK